MDMESIGSSCKGTNSFFPVGTHLLSFPKLLWHRYKSHGGKTGGLKTIMHTFLDVFFHLCYDILRKHPHRIVHAPSPLPPLVKILMIYKLIKIN